MAKLNLEKFGESTLEQISNLKFTGLQTKVLEAVCNNDEGFTDEEYFELALFFAENNGLNEDGFYYNTLVAKSTGEELETLCEIARSLNISRISDNLFQTDSEESYEAFYNAIAERRIGKKIYFYRGESKDWESDDSWVNIAELEF